MSRLNIPSANDQNLNYVRYPQEGNGWTLNGRWKGDTPINRTTGSAVPTSSQPQTNLSVNTGCTVSAVYQPCYDRPFRGYPLYTRASGIYHGNRGNRGPLNPIKHWRKQLQPSQGHITGKPTLNNVMWTPGGTVHLGSKSGSTLSQCTDLSCSPVISNYLHNSYVDPSCCNIIRNELSNFQPVAIHNPARRPRPRSSQTLLKKNYYTTGAAYLRSRVKLYEQNQLLSSVNTNHSGADFQLPGMPPAGNNYVYPTNNLTKGTQAFNSTYCVSDPSACCTASPSCRTWVTFKPSNPFYSTQGAVDSSTRVLQARYAAITKNNFDFQQSNSLKVQSIAGNSTSPMVILPGSTPSTYRGETVAPYFIKSKYQPISACQIPLYNQSIRSKTRISGRMPSGGTGIRIVCFSGR